MRAPFLTGLALGAALLLLPLAALGDAPSRADAQPTPNLLTLPASPTLVVLLCCNVLYVFLSRADCVYLLALWRV